MRVANSKRSGDVPKFKVKDMVRIKGYDNIATNRTPHYVRGKTGTIMKSHGVVGEYEHDHSDYRGPMYTVMFDLAELFGKSVNEKVLVDVHESWLELSR